ncbi:MAG: universal stress protein [Actinomycetales bacterium]|nr:universal stress protein [Actinomycetales bacterium]
MDQVIIVGVDGSQTANMAAQRAAELAVKTESKLVVMMAFDQADIERIEIGNDVWLISSHDEAEETAQSVARDLVATGAEIEVMAMHGKPAESLVDEAKRRNASLIVVGNRRAQGIGRILGSVAASVTQHAPCDVYIVKTV